MHDPDRLDRIEALVEKIGQRVDSNARAIEAISANTAEYQRDRARMYQFMADLSQSMADLSQSMANLAQSQAETKRELAQAQAEANKELAQAQAETKREMYRILSNLDQREAQLSQRQGQLSQRQGEIVDILKLLVQSQKDSNTDN